MPSTPYEALYVVRQHKRMIINSVDVVSSIKRAGFNVKSVMFEHMTLYEIIQSTRQVTLFVGPHGAGLTNIMWMHPHTVVIELMPYRQATESFRNLALLTRVIYIATGPTSPNDVFVCQTTNGRVTEGKIFDAPFAVPITTLQDSLKVASRILETSEFIFKSPCRVAHWLKHGYTTYAESFRHYDCHNTNFNLQNASGDFCSKF